MYKKRQRRFLFTWCFLILDVFTQCGNRSCAQADNDVAWFQGRSQNTCDIIDFARDMFEICLASKFLACDTRNWAFGSFEYICNDYTVGI